ncbi:MAG: DNA methyltransferase [Promethearchaeota archaeon]
MNEHINRAIPTSGHRPMYLIHKYFARKQEDVIREYIKSYSRRGDIILDPFCGSGVMVGEAIREGRKAVGADINPVSIFITRNTIQYESTGEILREFKNIENDVKGDIDALYQTRCRRCEEDGVKKTIPSICYTWDDGSLVDVRYECQRHGRIISPANEHDVELVQKIINGSLDVFFDENGKSKYWFPTDRLYYNESKPFKEKQRYDSVDQLFTRRNLVALAKLLNRIESIQEESLKESFKFAFSSMTHLASRMTPVRPTRPFSSSWTQQSYWFANNFMESNVWNLFTRAVDGRQGLIKAKMDLIPDFRKAKEVKHFENLKSAGNDSFLLLRTSIDELEVIGENSIDYVITDPPYSQSIQYGELLFMWGSWLKLMDGFEGIAKREIVVNPRQGKGDDEYEHLLHRAFTKIYKLLKPGKYCTVTFHNPGLKYRHILFKSVVMAGFEFEKVVYQPPPRPSAKSLLQPFGSLEGDYFFRFRKPTTPAGTVYKTVGKEKVENLIIDITRRIIMERGEPTPYTFIQNSMDPILYDTLGKHGLIMEFKPASIKDVLMKQVGTIFKLVDVEIGKERQGKKLVSKGWWLVDSSECNLQLPLRKRMEKVLVDFLTRKKTATLAEVQTEIYTKFQDSLTPDAFSIKQSLLAHAEKIASSGKWKIKTRHKSRNTFF